MSFIKKIHQLFASMPKVVRRDNKLFQLAILSFIFPMMLSFVYVNINPDAVYLIGNNFQIAQLEKSFDPSLTGLRPKQSLDEDIVMLNFYIVNNTIIGFAIFISGLLFGLGTLLLLAYQGISMGLRMGYIFQLGYNETLWPFLIGHTSFELFAIIVAGWCGLKMGLSVVDPGKLTRLKALSNTIQDVSRVMIVVLFLFLFAAVIETFWSSNAGIHVNAKYLLGACTWFILIYYLFVSGKKS
jgi:uncharacterized membrane protein SpoIIM required for sporulation